MQTQYAVTWDALVQAEPRLLQYERAAEQAMANKWTAWGGYVAWLPTFNLFRRAVQAVAFDIDTTPEQVEAAIIAHLRDVQEQVARRGRINGMGGVDRGWLWWVGVWLVGGCGVGGWVGGGGG